MSGIAVVFHTSGRPAAIDDLEPVLARQAHRALDGTSTTTAGPFAIGYQSTWTTPEAVGERQPRVLSGDLGLLVFDGRLDGRADLQARLGISCAGRSDSELVARSIERWGDEFATHLIGDFAVVWIRPEAGLMHCVRDRLGMKPLYIGTSAEMVVVASEPGAVVSHDAISDDLEPGAIESYREGWAISTGGSLYRDVKPVSKGTVVTVSRNGVSPARRYWMPSFEPRTGVSVTEVAEEYRALLTIAVRDRLRATGPIVCSVSGGIDSSSILAVALGSGSGREAATQAPLVPVAMTFPGYPIADESRYLRSLERWLGVDIIRVRPGPRSPAQIEAEAVRYRDLPDMPNDKFDVVARAVPGSRVQLNGLGGDHWFVATPWGVGGLFARGRWWHAARLLHLMRGTGWGDTYGELLAQHLARPHLGAAMSAVGRRSAGRWARAHAPQRVAATLDPGRYPRVPLHLLNSRRLVEGALWSAELAQLERRLSVVGVEPRSPFTDTRLVELACSLPPTAAWTHGSRRGLQRLAMTGLLPPEVQWRESKADLTIFAREELECAWEAGELSPVLRANGAGPLWSSIRETRLDEWTDELPELWTDLAISLWSRRSGRHAR